MQTFTFLNKVTNEELVFNAATEKQAKGLLSMAIASKANVTLNDVLQNWILRVEQE